VDTRAREVAAFNDAPTDHPNGGAFKVLGSAVGSTVGSVFESLSSLRRARTFHPRGVVIETDAIVPVDAGPPGFPDGEQRVLVRLSRGIGLPGSIPDIPGVAVRFIDAGGPGVHQDLLLATTFDNPAGRLVLRPTTSFTSGRFTSLLPYDASGTRAVFGAHLHLDGPARDLDDLADALRARPIELVLYWATPTSPWRNITTIVLGPTTEVADLPSLAFDVTNCVPGIRPAGVLNRIRPSAYLGSRKGRGQADTAELNTDRSPID
jgi:hypothetical protein